MTAKAQLLLQATYEYESRHLDPEQLYQKQIEGMVNLLDHHARGHYGTQDLIPHNKNQESIERRDGLVISTWWFATALKIVHLNIITALSQSKTVILTQPEAIEIFREILTENFGKGFTDKILEKSLGRH